MRIGFSHGFSHHSALLHYFVLATLATISIRVKEELYDPMVSDSFENITLIKTSFGKYLKEIY